MILKRAWLSNRRRRLFILFSLAASFTVGFLYSHRADFAFSIHSQSTVDGKFKRKVKCSVTSNVGEGKSCRLKIAIPCESRRQQVDLMRKLPRLKHEFMMSLSQPGMDEVVRDRNFRELRRQLLQTLNKHGDDSVRTLYFEEFFTE